MNKHWPVGKVPRTRHTGVDKNRGHKACGNRDEGVLGTRHTIATTRSAPEAWGAQGPLRPQRPLDSHLKLQPCGRRSIVQSPKTLNTARVGPVGCCRPSFSSEKIPFFDTASGVLGHPHVDETPSSSHCFRQDSFFRGFSRKRNLAWIMNK